MPVTIINMTHSNYDFFYTFDPLILEHEKKMFIDKLILNKNFNYICHLETLEDYTNILTKQKFYDNLFIFSAC